MAKFKKGDKVVRIIGFRDCNWCDAVACPSWPFVVRECDNSNLRLDGVEYVWSPAYFELYVEPQPEPVTITGPPVQQIPGVPDGYRLVRIGVPKKDEVYVNSSLRAVDALADFSDGGYAIVEPIVSPAPPTPIPSKVKVQLNRYLVGDMKAGRVVVSTCTAEYAERNYSNYRLLGPSETLELEVEV